MIKIKRVIFPNQGYETIMEILEEFGLKEKHQEVSDKLDSLPPGSEEYKALIKNLPGKILVKLSRAAAKSSMESKEISLSIARKLGLDEKKSEELAKKLIDQFISRSEIIEEETKTVKEPAGTLGSREENQKIPDVGRRFKNEEDIYREPIE